MKNNGASEKHINNNLKAILNFANHIDANATLLDIERTKKYSSTKIGKVEILIQQTTNKQKEDYKMRDLYNRS